LVRRQVGCAVSCCGQSAERSAAIQSSLNTLSAIEAPRPSRAIVRPERLCVVTTRYNPLGWKRPEENYQRFREGIESAGVPLFTLHVDFDGDINSGPYDIVRRASRYKHLLWQKEACINEAVRQIQLDWPGEFDAIAWVDADVLFQNANWVSDTLDALSQVRIVQLFEHFARLNPSGAIEYRYPGAAYMHVNRLDGRYKNPGGAWACRLDTFNAMGGLFPYNFFGGGDDTTCHVWRGSTPSRLQLHCGQVELMRQWRISAHSAIRRSVGYVPGEVHHLWHGSIGNRKYNERWENPQIREIDVRTDIEIDEQGLLAWRAETCDCKRDAVNSYFRRREEDGPVSPIPVPPEGFTRHALGHLWPFRWNDLWRWHCQQLIQRRSLFNGRCLVSVAIDDRTATREEVEQVFEGHGIELRFFENDPKTGERDSFHWGLEQLASEIDNNAACLFYWQSKGVSVQQEDPDRQAAVRKWAGSMWRINGDCWPLVERQLRTAHATGAHRQPWPKTSRMHYSGTFFWVRMAALQGRPWKQLDSDRWSVERWPGQVFESRETACLFDDRLDDPDSTGSLYRDSSWQTLSPQLQDFLQANSTKNEEQ